MLPKSKLSSYIVLLYPKTADSLIYSKFFGPFMVAFTNIHM